MNASNGHLIPLIPFTFWTPTPRGRHVSKKLDVKTWLFRGPNRAHQSCHPTWSHRGRTRIHSQIERLPYKLVDLKSNHYTRINFGVTKIKFTPCGDIMEPYDTAKCF